MTKQIESTVSASKSIVWTAVVPGQAAASDRCLWAKEKDVALGITTEV